jgi:cytidyltransferase-like protein
MKKIIPKNKKYLVVVVSGYYDPIHTGHLEQIHLAKELAGKNGKLIVILNNDEQAILKKGKSFMIQEERRKIIEALRHVDAVYMSIDTDMSVCKSLEVLNPDIFAKGGDRIKGELLEDDICKKMKIKIVDGLGKKIQASSDLIKNWEEKK